MPSAGLYQLCTYPMPTIRGYISSSNPKIQERIRPHTRSPSSRPNVHVIKERRGAKAFVPACGQEGIDPMDLAGSRMGARRKARLATGRSCRFPEFREHERVLLAAALYFACVSILLTCWADGQLGASGAGAACISDIDQTVFFLTFAGQLLAVEASPQVPEPTPLELPVYAQRHVQDAVLNPESHSLEAPMSSHYTNDHPTISITSLRRRRASSPLGCPSRTLKWSTRSFQGPK